MDQIKIGAFIATCRKEQQLTQAQLAEKLNITDRAVSKWENGKSMPDSSIMLELCEILGIKVNELLSGERMDTDAYTQSAEENLMILKRKDENSNKKNVLFAIIYSVVLFLGIVICSICDVAITGELTWSTITLSSIIFTYVISFPIVILWKKGITGSLIALSIFLIPYLYLLGILINVPAVFTIGWRMSLISIVYLWIIYFVSCRLHTRKFRAAGISVLLAIPLNICINVTLSKLLSEPRADIWDILTIFILLIIAFLLFLTDYAKNKGIPK
ncbi:MAG: helix-turn-helix domain-containing protein [Lachnospiraceae bacterium]|nr:helix-turn-helix domain-containing protein [Lachnospiraceae bacterium]